MFQWMHFSGWYQFWTSSLKAIRFPSSFVTRDGCLPLKSICIPAGKRIPRGCHIRSEFSTVSNSKLLSQKWTFAKRSGLKSMCIPASVEIHSLLSVRTSSSLETITFAQNTTLHRITHETFQLYSRLNQFWFQPPLTSSVRSLSPHFIHSRISYSRQVNLAQIEANAFGTVHR
jgi:hypothetical protein